MSDADFRLMALVEAGIVKREKLKDLPPSEICPLDLRSSERQLRFSDLSLTFIVVAVGYAIAIAIFVLEIVAKWTTSCLKRRKGNGKMGGWSERTWRICCTWRSSSSSSSNKSKRIVVVPRLEHVVIDRLFDERTAVNPRKMSPTPLYENVSATMAVFAQRKKQCINGRDYYVVLDRHGDRRLIPIRTPSAFLFHYTT